MGNTIFVANSPGPLYWHVLHESVEFWSPNSGLERSSCWFWSDWIWNVPSPWLFMFSFFWVNWSKELGHTGPPAPAWHCWCLGTFWTTRLAPACAASTSHTRLLRSLASVQVQYNQQRCSIQFWLEKLADHKFVGYGVAKYIITCVLHVCISII